MKRILIALALFVSATISMAQSKGQGHRFNPEEFIAKLEAHITQKAGLTPSEAEKFFPIYHEMKAKQREISHKIHELKRKHPDAKASEGDYNATVMRIAELDAEIAKLEATYYKKMCKAISAKKVYSAILADDSFHREMLQQFNGGKHGGNHGR